LSYFLNDKDITFVYNTCGIYPARMFFCWATILMPKTTGKMRITANLIKREIALLRCSIIMVYKPKKMARVEYLLNRFGKEKSILINIKKGMIQQLLTGRIRLL